MSESLHLLPRFHAGTRLARSRASTQILIASNMIGVVEGLLYAHKCVSRGRVSD